MLETETPAKVLLDSYLHYKTRASLHLDGVRYCIGGDFIIIICRVTHRPSNRFIGLMVDVEAVAFPSKSAAVAAVLTEMMLLFREAAAADVPGSKIHFQQVVEGDAEEYGVDECFVRQQWAVLLCQLSSQFAGI